MMRCTDALLLLSAHVVLKMGCCGESFLPLQVQSVIMRRYHTEASNLEQCNWFLPLKNGNIAIQYH